MIKTLILGTLMGMTVIWAFAMGFNTGYEQAAHEVKELVEEVERAREDEIDQLLEYYLDWANMCKNDRSHQGMM